MTGRVTKETSMRMKQGVPSDLALADPASLQETKVSATVTHNQPRQPSWRQRFDRSNKWQRDFVLLDRNSRSQVKMPLEYVKYSREAQGECSRRQRIIRVSFVVRNALFDSQLFCRGRGWPNNLVGKRLPAKQQFRPVIPDCVLI